MKQLKLLFVGLLLVAANGLFAQITFTEGTFEEALAKAKAEKKNIFIDFYAFKPSVSLSFFTIYHRFFQNCF